MSRKRVIAWLLSIVIVVGCLNVPMNTINVSAAEEYFTVTFDSNEGYLNHWYDSTTGEWDYSTQKRDEIQVEKDGSIEWLYNPGREGYVFKGYQIDGDDSLYWYYSDEENNKKDIHEYQVTEDVTFHAVWEEAYTVSFDGNDGYLNSYYNDSTDDWEYYLEKGEIRVETDSYLDGLVYYNPGREGYVFKGFQTDGDDSLYVVGYSDEEKNQKNIFEYQVTGDVTFHAVWAEAYTVTFDGNGGYVDGSYDDEAGEWVYNKETKEVQAEKDAYFSSNYYIEPQPRNGYVFKGYQIDGDDSLYVTYSDEENNLKDIGEYQVTGDVTFHAVWAEAYTVTFDGNAGYVGGGYWDDETSEWIFDEPTTDVQVEKGSKLEWMPKPSKREGYVFKGYQLEGDDSIYDEYGYEEENIKNIYDYEVTGDVTFKAVWAEAWNVTYDGNGGQVAEGWLGPDRPKYVDQVSRQVEKNTRPNYEWFEREGYLLRGFKVSGEDTVYVLDNRDLSEGEEPFDNLIITRDMTLIALWKEEVLLDITFDPGEGYFYNDASGEKDFDTRSYADAHVIGAEKIYPGDDIWITYSCRADGKVFSGWKSSADGKIYNSYDYVNVTEDTTFTAQYSEATTVLFDLDGGYYRYTSGPMSAHNYYGYPQYAVAEGEHLIMSDMAVYSSVDGMVFAGWQRDGDDKIYSMEEVEGLTFAEDTVFVAQWTEGFKVTFCSEEGYIQNYDPEEKTFVTSVAKNHIFDGIIPISETDYNSWYGHVVKYWTLEGDDKEYTEEDINNMIIDRDLTFTAHWGNAPKITIIGNGGKIYYGHTIVEEASYYTYFGETPHISTEAPEGYVLTGWKVEDDSLLSGTIIEDLSNYKVNGDVTFTAQWKEYDPEEFCTVIYDPNGGYFYNGPSLSDEPISYIYKKGKEIQLIGTGQPGRPYNDGYDLAGWRIEGGDDTVYEPCVYVDGELIGGEYTVNEDVTFIAVWKKIISVSFVTEYGAFADNSQETKISMPEGEALGYYEMPVCDDRLFVGYQINDGDQILYSTEYLWDIGENPDDYQQIYDYVPEDGDVLKAVWESEVYKITYEANGGYFGSKEEGITSENRYVTKGLAMPDMPWANSDTEAFVGWKEKGKEDAKVYKKGSTAYEEGEFFSIVPTEDMTFEAVWAEGCKVTVDYDGGKLSSDEEELEPSNLIFEKDQAFPAADWFGTEWFDKLCKEGYTLDGWVIVGDTDEKVYSDISQIIVTEDMTIKAKWIEDVEECEHVWDEGIITKDATCAEKGEMTYTCTICGETKKEEIAEIAHTVVEDEAIPATCTETGKTEGKHCSVCDEILEGQETIPALGHSWDDGVVTKEATCKETGEKEFTCEVCGETKTESIPKLAHSWDGGVVTKAPTCTAKGVKTFTCTECGETKTESIAANGHTVVKDPAVAATTTSTGKTEGSHCSVCGAVIKAQTTIPKITPASTTTKKSEPKYSEEWVDGKWYDKSGKQTYSGTMGWKSNSTGWWIEDTAGWYPKNQWQKIDGKWYYFKPDGYMAAGEYYNGYWFNSNGSWDSQYKLSWKQNATGWWVEDKSGWWPQNSWLKIDGYWYYFNGSGYMATNQYVGGWWVGADGVCY